MSVNNAGGNLFFIKGTHPCLSMVSANNNCQRCTINVCSFAYFCKTFFTLNHNQTHRLEVCSSRSHVSRLQCHTKVYNRIKKVSVNLLINSMIASWDESVVINLEPVGTYMKEYRMKQAVVLLWQTQTTIA